MAQTKDHRSSDYLVAVAGNPNSGKTTLFNALTGANARIANHPGITVEIRTGHVTLPGAGRVSLIDVPGTYSLTARSPDEEVAINALLGRKGMKRPDAVLLVLDATTPERNFYLMMQVLEFDLPTIAVINMIDAARGDGIEIDFDALRRTFGIPVVGTVARKRQGIGLLRDTLDELLSDLEAAPRPGWLWEPEPPLDADLASFESLIAEEVRFPLETPGARRAFALWLLTSLHDGSELEVRPRLREHTLTIQAEHASAGRDLALETVAARYAAIDRIAATVVRRGPQRSNSTERIDAVLTHPLWGSAVFVILMGLIFQALFSWSDPMIGLIEHGFNALSGVVRVVLPAGVLRDLLTDGIISGVGGVLSFLPQILFLFLFISILEGTGYLSRAAFLVDRLMRRLGLHGHAFVPMLSGFACAIPAIMATRTIDNRRDRMLTIMAVPLITCSARLPVYTLIIALLFPAADKIGFLSSGTVVLLGIYLLSATLSLLAVGLLGKTVLKGQLRPLLLELPPYRMPGARSVLQVLWERCRAFLTTAGSVILVATVVLWALLAFPRVTQTELAATDAAVQQAEQLQDSYAGRIGTAIEPVLEPLGFNWKIGVGLIGAFAAREVFVGTMGVIYGVGEESEEQSHGLREAMRRDTRVDGTPLWTPLTGVSLIVFFMIAMQCMSTLAVTRRETGSWGWTLFMLAYLTGTAYLASLIVYQGGRLLGYA
ncbi:ferrous iron transport protein B [bacterium]|nr:ferrous iron transport protein B [bacterium]